MEPHESARLLADGSFSLVHDAARRNLIFARSQDDQVHCIVAEAVDAATGLWLVECLRHGASLAADALEAAAGKTQQILDQHDEEHTSAVHAAVEGQRLDSPEGTK